MKNIIFNPIWSNHKSKIGAIESSETVTLTIKITREYNIYQLRLIIKDDNNNIIRVSEVNKGWEEEDYNNYQVIVEPLEAGLYWYCFEFDDYYGTHYIASNHSLDAILTDYFPIYWQLLVHDPFKGTLSWFKGKVIYQIMVDRFFKGGKNSPKSDVYMHKYWDEMPYYLPYEGKYAIDFFGGDLAGIVKKLDYLSSLHVGAIYLNPIFEAQSNHKYDTGDYLKIDSMFGTESDFKKLCEEASKRDIKIILDGVFNHTGDNSIYFNKYNQYDSVGAYQSKDSKYYSWFKFYNHPHGYDSWWGFTTLPTLNQKSKEYVDFITGDNGVLTKWLKQGASGYRLDVVDELSNDFVGKISAAIKKHNPENIVIGEVWEDASHKTAYSERKKYFNGHELDSVMNYPFKNAIIGFVKDGNPIKIRDVIRGIVNNYPKHVLDSLMNVLGTHDTARILSEFSNANYSQMNNEQMAKYQMSDKEYESALLKVAMAVAIQYTLPGVPSIYYGDEAGLEGFKDPFCRRTYPWKKENQRLLWWYQLLGEIRQNEVYVDGVYQEVYCENNVFAFARVNSTQKIITVANNSNNPFTFYIDKAYELITNQEVTYLFEVPPHKVAILKSN